MRHSTRRLALGTAAVLALAAPMLAYPAPMAAQATGVSPHLVATIHVSGGPYRLAVDPVRDTVYSGNTSSDSMSVINAHTNRVVATIPGVACLLGMAMNPVTNMIYAGNECNGDVYVISGQTDRITATVVPNVGRPSAVGVDPLTDRIYATANVSSAVSVIAGRSNSIVATVGVGDDPCGIAVDPLRDTVFVSNGPYNSISVINGRTNRVTATISGLSNCLAFTIDPLQGTVYVAGAGPTIAAIDEDTLRVKGTIHLGPPASKGVNGLATDALSRTLYAVTNVPKTATRSLGKLVAIDERTNTIMGSVRVGNFPAGVATNPITHLVYVANEGDDTVSVVEGP